MKTRLYQIAVSLLVITGLLGITVPAQANDRYVCVGINKAENQNPSATMYSLLAPGPSTPTDQAVPNYLYAFEGDFIYASNQLVEKRSSLHPEYTHKGYFSGLPSAVDEFGGEKFNYMGQKTVKEYETFALDEYKKVGSSTIKKGWYDITIVSMITEYIDIHGQANDKVTAREEETGWLEVKSMSEATPYPLPGQGGEGDERLPSYMNAIFIGPEANPRSYLEVTYGDNDDTETLPGIEVLSGTYPLELSNGEILHVFSDGHGTVILEMPLSSAVSLVSLGD